MDKMSTPSPLIRRSKMMEPKRRDSFWRDFLPLVHGMHQLKLTITREDAPYPNRKFGAHAGGPLRIVYHSRERIWV